MGALQEARGKIWMCDVDGLLTTTREKGDLHGHKKSYAKNVEPMRDLGEIVKKIKPSVGNGFKAAPFLFRY